MPKFMVPGIHLKHKLNDVNKSVIVFVLVSVMLIGGWKIIWTNELKIY